MPFLPQIVGYINEALKAGSLNQVKLQPAKLHGLATVISRSKRGSKDVGKLEQLPAIVKDGKIDPITPDKDSAIQIYHRILSKAYSYEKRSHGDDYDIKCITELSLVAITNGKLTGTAKEVVEPVVLFGLPQRIPSAKMAELKINRCLITPVASTMDAGQVFKQEYPSSEYFLTEQVSMFSIRYRIELTFGRQCIDHCLCE
ncbi:hypothetical protein JMG10_07550 [Nostoc ellipsosporum NOK]|nr:hypothetical protein [Nostoc ellipsosporum NOK]